MNKKEGVYIIYGNTDKIIYVGISTDIDKRIEEHKKNNDKRYFAPQINHIKYFLEEISIATTIEGILIKILNPIYNKRSFKIDKPNIVHFPQDTQWKQKKPHYDLNDPELICEILAYRMRHPNEQP